jgi:hypothetical protein
VETKLNAQLAQLTGAAGSATPRMQRANDLTADINRLQARYSVVDEQYRNRTMENSAPGAVYLSAAALPPLHAARNTVLRNGLIVLFAGFILAVGAALIAYNMDPRVYIAADVERVLGVAPMALLPDLYEVDASVSEEYMLRLAAAVEHAHQQGALNSCIFTGVTAGAGATTVSTRVSSMLEAMGRETVFVDAVGAPPPRHDNALNPGSELVHSPRGSRSTALLQQMTQEASEESVVVADTAPLLVSGETEYLARFVDAAIVVVESGVTTRAQLREVARTLHRLDVSAVGFVLNRIPLAKADPSFRQSVHAVETRLRVQARVFERAERPERPLAKAEPAPEKPPQSPYTPESPYTSAGLGHLWRLSEETSHEPVPSAPRSLIPEPEPSAPAAHPVTSAAQPAPPAHVEEEHPAHITWDHPSLQPTFRRPEWKDPEPDEPAYLRYLHPAPSAAAVAAATEAEASEGRTFEEPAFIAHEAAAAPHIAAEQAPPGPAFAQQDPYYIVPEPLTWPEPVAQAPEPPDHPDVPDYILKATAPAAQAPAPADSELPAYLRRAWEPEAPKVELAKPERPKMEPARPDPPVADLSQFEYLRPEPSEFETVMPQSVASRPEPVAPEPVATAIEPMTAEPVSPEPVAAAFAPAPKPELLPDPLMETLPPNAVWNPPTEIRSTVTPFVAHPMRGREPLRSFNVEARPAATPPAEILAMVTPEPAPQPEPAPPPRRDYSVSVMPPLPAARKREPHREQVSESPVLSVAPSPVGHSVEEIRPAAAYPAVDKRQVEEDTLFPFPQRAAETHIAPVPEPQRSIASVADELLSSPVGPEVDAEDLPYSAASRLGGLRNLLVSLGLKNLHREAEFRRAGIESDSERNPERAVYAEPANAPEGALEPERVAARPEIIPPRIGPEPAERKDPIRPVKSPRVKGWDSPDDVEILPSRRGQYRRR